LEEDYSNYLTQNQREEHFEMITEAEMTANSDHDKAVISRTVDTQLKTHKSFNTIQGIEILKT
jgi:hypothetical protein